MGAVGAPVGQGRAEVLRIHAMDASFRRGLRCQLDRSDRPTKGPRVRAHREQLAQIALNGRRNAALNEKAIYREPLSLEDYLAARLISTPLCLFDCDAPCDGSTAVVVSHADYAPDAPRVACHVNAVGTALRGRPSWDQFDDMTTFASARCGPRACGNART